MLKHPYFAPYKGSCVVCSFNQCTKTHLLIHLGSEGRDTLYVTCNGFMMGTFSRAEAIQAHSVQFGLLYIFGLSYGGKNKKDKATRNFFEFVTYYLWGIRPTSEGSSRKKRVCTEVEKLWKQINLTEEI